jgi:hypothetical protein
MDGWVMTAAQIQAAAEQLSRDPTGHSLKDVFRMIAQLAERVAELEARRSTLSLKQKP